MNVARFLQRTFIVASLLILILNPAEGQQRDVKGTVYDRTLRYGIHGVSVVSSSGTGTTTDSLGRYHIKLALTDSIQFSYLGKGTQKFPVKDIPENQPFDMSLQVDAESLPGVTVRQSIYRLDSLANREEYRKAFDFEKNYMAEPQMGLGVGVSLDALFSGKKLKQAEALQKRLEQQEKDKYVDYKFNKPLVRRVTGLKETDLDSFMVNFRPSYETLQSFENQYEYYHYIKSQADIYLEYWKKQPADKPKEPSE